LNPIKAAHSGKMIDQVHQALKSAGQDGSDLSLFANILYAHMNQEDLDLFGPDKLADMAVSAFAFLAEKPENSHKIRYRDISLPNPQPDTIQDRTIVEILNNDMPFLVDSVIGEIQERGFDVYLVSHPILDVRRDSKGKLEGLSGEGQEDQKVQRTQESLIYIHLEPLSESQKAELTQALDEILHEVRLVVEDWRAMMVKVSDTVTKYSENVPQAAVADVAESVQFLKWLADKNFTFLGMREYELIGSEQDADLQPIKDSGLGILRDPDVHVLRRGHEMLHWTPEVRKFFFSPSPLIVTKANVRSNVHRRVHMDYIGVKLYDQDGAIRGELRIVGLFTSSAYTRSTKSIPLLRHKVDLVLQRFGHPPNSHSGKALLNIIETFPRDELFQIDSRQLYQAVRSIHDLELRPRTRVISRLDEFDRFVSVLVYVARDRFVTDVRVRIGEFLAETYSGRVSAYYPFFPEGQLVRLHFIIGRYEGETPTRDQDFLEAEIERIARTWEDDLSDTIKEHFTDTDKALNLAEKYRAAFSVGYQDTFSPARAIQDIDKIELLDAGSPVAVDFYREDDNRPDRIRIALYHFNGPVSLSRRVPILENLGFSVIDERSYKIEPKDQARDAKINLHDMVLATLDGEPIDLKVHKTRLEECFLAVWDEDTSNDAYNRLVQKASMSWREAGVIRAYGAYLRQIRAPFGQAYLCETLIRHNALVREIIELFKIRNDPKLPISKEARRSAQEKILSRLDEAHGAIPSLDEDRILRHFSNLALSTMRTNFFQTDENGRAPETLTFKFDSAKVDGLPAPRPFAEIFVYSTRFEGIHLRGGKIARGGIRWSDRPQDFRTEVASLAKAQQVKNTVIVPTGSKGGFVPKKLPREGSREEILKEGVACYRIFISSLLSITDNLDGTDIIAPDQVVRHDGDDPYLVVAADKGTATFSDYANEISTGAGYWLGDAFASGGSAGYDHKKMGITARGGWEAVKRHFREMEIDIQTQSVSVIGVGDMSGDVFGNGMLLSKMLKLVAAFDHRDIFVDPDPDPDKSWTERKRLFDLSRSSWQDYDQDLLSRGGQIYSRQAKSLRLTPEIQNLVGIEKADVTPNELIRAILASEADLLWFGGIGTYVRAGTESNDDAGDRANDALRISSAELRVKVIGEGANLGMTHRSRIQFAKAGGRVNSDAIDNSAGVNSSDLEVNIKIALSAAIGNGNLDRAARDAFLASMTEEVAEACLRNNYLQTLAISLGERDGLADFGFQQRLMRELESTGLLVREIEYLPSDSEIAERFEAGEPLTRPELSVLLAYSKLDLFKTLIESQVPDDPYLAAELDKYFPVSLREKFGEEVKTHRLRREIIATRLANSIINRGGATMVVRLKEETGHDGSDIAYAFSAARAILDVDHLYEAIDALDNKVKGKLQLDLYAAVQSAIRRLSAWLLRNVDLSVGLSGVVDLYRTGLGTFDGVLDDVLGETQKKLLGEETRSYESGGVPAVTANALAKLDILFYGADITLVADAMGCDVADVADIYCGCGEFLRLTELRQLARQLELTDYFDRIALNSALDGLASAQRNITQDILSQKNGESSLFESWRQGNEQAVLRAQNGLNEIIDSGALSLSKLTVAVAHLGKLADAA